MSPVRTLIFVTTLFLVRIVILARTLILIKILMDEYFCKDAHGRSLKIMDAEWKLGGRWLDAGTSTGSLILPLRLKNDGKTKSKSNSPGDAFPKFS